MNKIFDSQKDFGLISGVQKKEGSSIFLSGISSVKFKCRLNYSNRVKVVLICKNISGAGDVEVLAGEEKICQSIGSSAVSEIPFVFKLNEFSKDLNITLSSTCRRGKLKIFRILVFSDFESKNDSIEYLDKNNFDNKLNIAFIVPYSIYGGAEVFLKNIFSENKYNNYKVIFLSKNKLSDFISKERCIYSSIDKLNLVIKKENFDILCFYNSKAVYDKISIFNGSKRIVEIYHSDFKWKDSMSNTQHHNVDWILRISGMVGNHIVGIKEKSKIFPPLINFEKFMPRSRNSEVIGTVARLSNEKNLQYLIELKKIMPNKEFVVYGEGSESIKRSLELEGIRVLGFKEDIHEHYNFGAFVLPSNIEGLPITIIEALASNIPAFMKDTGAAREIFEGLNYDWELTGDPELDSKKIILACDKNYNFRQIIKKDFCLSRSGEFFEELSYGTDISKLWSNSFNPNKYFDKIYCINLDSREDKWKRSLKSFLRWGLRVSRYSARHPRHAETEYHWSKLSNIEPNEAKRRDRKMMTKIGEVGCYLSHLNLIKEAKAAGYKKILIFEDDVIFSKSFEKELKFMITIPDWAIIYLGGSQYSWDNVRPHSNKFYYSKDTDGTFGYALNLDYYDEILSAIGSVEHPIDWDFRIGIQDKLPGKCFTFFPNIVIAQTSDSDIRGGRDLKSHCGLMRWDLDKYEI